MVNIDIINNHVTINIPTLHNSEIEIYYIRCIDSHFTTSGICWWVAFSKQVVSGAHEVDRSVSGAS